MLRRKGLVAVLWLHALAIAGLVVAYVLMLRSAIAGHTSVGRFTAASLAATALASTVVQVFRQAAQARGSSFYLPSALRVLDLPKADRADRLVALGGAAAAGWFLVRGSRRRGLFDRNR